jgi:hypothetical protein
LALIARVALASAAASAAFVVARRWRFSGNLSALLFSDCSANCGAVCGAGGAYALPEEIFFPEPLERHIIRRGSRAAE